MVKGTRGLPSYALCRAWVDLSFLVGVYHGVGDAHSIPSDDLEAFMEGNLTDT